MRIDVIWLGEKPGSTSWPLGNVWASAQTPRAVHQLVEDQLPGPGIDGWLFWDGSLGLPEPGIVLHAFDRPGDIWHAGLRLGMGAQPAMLDTVVSTWMLNRDPYPNLEATSWRLSLRACLMKAEVLRQMGNLQPEFLTLDGCGLEFGYRCVTRGVLVRHLPSLAGKGNLPTNVQIPLEDASRLIYAHFGRRWGDWALLRTLMRGEISPRKLARILATIRGETLPPSPSPFRHAGAAAGNWRHEARVSVLIPTLDRYPYLRTLLAQLREQSVRPIQVIVIDQTSPERRETSFQEEFSELPLCMIHLERPGQCVARNTGLEVAQGDFILFLDDDVELRADYIERHLNSLNRFRANVSSGVADEKGIKELPEHFRFIRLSDVFPTGNTLVHRSVLERSGLFDLAYDHGQRADGDLGMRAYLTGALMVLNPDVRLFHHRAPSGGLRTHGARRITYDSSRTRLLQRQLFSATEVYLAKRYFGPRQLKEMWWLTVLGTFSMRGNLILRVLKAIVSLLFMPITMWQLHKRLDEGDRMLRRFPVIPSFENSNVRGEYHPCM